MFKRKKKSTAPTSEPKDAKQLTAGETVILEPEVIFDRAKDAGRVDRIFRRRMIAAKNRIVKFIEAKSVKSGLDSRPIIDTMWQLLLLLPRMVRLLYKLLMDSRVPLGLRLKCGLVLAYVISPLDLLAEGILGPLGMIDDVAIVVVMLDVLFNKVDPSIIEEHWSGSPEMLKFLKNSVSVVKIFLPPTVYKAVLKFFGGDK